MNSQILKRGINLLKMITLPIAVYIFFFLLTKAFGVENFGVGSDLVVIFRNAIYTGFIALAVSYNLTSGRIDFSVGSTLILSTILGASLALRHGLGPIELLLLSILFGVILGSIGGLVYILLRIPPMVVSLGVAMTYEALGYIVSGGAGVKLIGNQRLLVWATNPHIYIMCAVIVFILYIILNFTTFGYNTNALRSGQELAVNVGINEKVNTVLCYAIAGGLLAAAGVVNMSVLGTISPDLGLTSMSYIQNAFLPMFIGVTLSKYGDRNVGVIIGALTQAIITAAFGKLGVSTSWQTILNGMIVLAFFAYSFNYYKIVEWQMFKEKKHQAKLDQLEHS
jgi:ribose transport system permease protein